MNRYLNILIHPSKFLDALLAHYGCFIPDETYLKILFFIRLGKKLNLNHPTSFNEKMNWLKIYDRKELYTTMADKYAVKAFVADKIGWQYVVDNYGVYEKWEDIDFDKLPNQFVIKATHDSGGAFICRDKSTFDFEKVARRINRNLRNNYFYPRREWPYKNIKPRIIIDKFLDDKSGKELRDYKFWCFNGKPTYMYITNKGKIIKENFYDMDFNPIPINHGFKRSMPEYNMPTGFVKMKELASILSKGIPFVRVDFFEVRGKVFFGEYTFFDWAGLKPFKGDWDIKIGELLHL